MSEENTTPETPVAPAAPAPGTPEYNAQLAAEGAAATGNVPAKFINADGTINVDNLAKSYMELERGRGLETATAAEPGDGQGKPSDPIEEEAKTPDDPKALVEELRVPEVVEEEAEEAPIEEQAKAIGVTADDLAEMTSAIMRTGTVTDEQRADLNNRGIADAVIDAMVDGQRARMRDQYAQAAEIVGSSDRLSKIFGWAAQNLSPEQRDQINAGLASSASELTLRGLASMYDAAQGAKPQAKEPNRITRQATLSQPQSHNAVQGFASKAEMYKAMDEARANPALMDEYYARMLNTKDPTSLR